MEIIAFGVACFLIWYTSNDVQKVSKTHFKIVSDNRDNDPFEVLIQDVVFHAQALLAWNAKKL